MKPTIIAIAMILVGITASLTYAGETARIEVAVDAAPTSQTSTQYTVPVQFQTVLQNVSNTIRYEDRVRTVQVPTTVMVDQEITEKWAIIEQLVQQPQIQVVAQTQAVCTTCVTPSAVRSTDVSIGIGDDRGGRCRLLQRLRDRRSNRNTDASLGATSVNVQVGCRRCRF